MKWSEHILAFLVLNLSARLHFEAHSCCLTMSFGNVKKLMLDCADFLELFLHPYTAHVMPGILHYSRCHNTQHHNTQWTVDEPHGRYGHRTCTVFRPDMIGSRVTPRRSESRANRSPSPPRVPESAIQNSERTLRYRAGGGVPAQPGALNQPYEPWPRPKPNEFRQVIPDLYDFWPFCARKELC